MKKILALLLFAGMITFVAYGQNTNASKYKSFTGTFKEGTGGDMTTMNVYTYTFVDSTKKEITFVEKSFDNIIGVKAGLISMARDNIGFNNATTNSNSKGKKFKVIYNPVSINKVAPNSDELYGNIVISITSVEK